MTVSLDELTACGAHRRGHFLLSSGLHSADYLQCALYLAVPSRAETAGRALGDRLVATHLIQDVVVAPAIGGLIIGHEVARAVDRPFLFTERVDGRMTLRRGFTLTAGQRVVIVEDVVTTGRSTREVIEVIGTAGASVSAVASMVNRSGEGNPFAPVPFVFLIEATFATWTETECPMCADDRPLDHPGSRPVASS